MGERPAILHVAEIPEAALTPLVRGLLRIIDQQQEYIKRRCASGVVESAVVETPARSGLASAVAGASRPALNDPDIRTTQPRISNYLRRCNRQRQRTVCVPYLPDSSKQS